MRLRPGRGGGSRPAFSPTLLSNPATPPPPRHPSDYHLPKHAALPHPRFLRPGSHIEWGGCHWSSVFGLVAGGAVALASCPTAAGARARAWKRGLGTPHTRYCPPSPPPPSNLCNAQWVSMIYVVGFPYFYELFRIKTWD